MSLSQCKIGDSGATQILNSVRSRPNIVWLDLSSCSLTSRSGGSLHDLVRHQTACRENAAWKASLRHGSPSMDLMGGLRRLTLNDNDVGDAADQLSRALELDKWVKALDLQYCHLNDAHLSGLVKAAASNPGLVIIDVRNNVNLSRDLLDKLDQVLDMNQINDDQASSASRHRFHRIDYVGHRPVIKARSPASRRSKITLAAAVATPGVRRPPPLSPVWTSRAKRLSRSPAKRRADATPAMAESAVTPAVPAPQKITAAAAAEVMGGAGTAEEELRNERRLRTDAERQVVQIYGELESAWNRTAKLERKLKQLKQQRRKASAPPPEAPPPGECGGVWVEPVTLMAFQTCLSQLRGILHELKDVSGAAAEAGRRVHPHSTSRAKDDSAGGADQVDQVLQVMQAAVRQLTAGIAPPPPPLVTLPTAAAMLPADGGLAARGRSETLESRSTVPAAVTRNLTSTPVAPAASAAPAGGSSGRESSSLVTTSTSRSNRRPEAAAGSSSSIICTQVTNGSRPSAATVAAEAAESGSNRISSLQSLQGDLQELLAQFRTKNDAKDASTTLGTGAMESLLSVDDSAARPPVAGDPSAAAADYTMDFDDSAATSIKSISKSRSTGVAGKVVASASSSSARVRTEPAAGLASERIRTPTSTINMSSIVDLLGDFSLADVGSSTLSPP